MPLSRNLRPEMIRQSLWQGSQLARTYEKTVDTGYAALSAELPGGGWPLGKLVELLVQQPGVGEIRLLRPALAAIASRPIALVQPPHIPNTLAFTYLGIPATMGHIDSRFVILLVLLGELPKPATRFNPVVDVDGEQYVMLTQAMGAVSAKLLKQGVGSLADRYDEIVVAMDLLLQGF
jgi:hypothetical protein